MYATTFTPSKYLYDMRPLARRTCCVLSYTSRCVPTATGYRYVNVADAKCTPLCHFYTRQWWVFRQTQTQDMAATPSDFTPVTWKGFLEFVEKHPECKRAIIDYVEMYIVMAAQNRRAYERSTQANYDLATTPSVINAEDVVIHPQRNKKVVRVHKGYPKTRIALHCVLTPEKASRIPGGCPFDTIVDDIDLMSPAGRIGRADPLPYGDLLQPELKQNGDPKYRPDAIAKANLKYEVAGNLDGGLEEDQDYCWLLFVRFLVRVGYTYLFYMASNGEHYLKKDESKQAYRAEKYAIDAIPVTDANREEVKTRRMNNIAKAFLELEVITYLPHRTTIFRTNAFSGQTMPNAVFRQALTRKVGTDDDSKPSDEDLAIMRDPGYDPKGLYKAAIDAGRLRAPIRVMTRSGELLKTSKHCTDVVIEEGTISRFSFMFIDGFESDRYYLRTHLRAPLPLGKPVASKHAGAQTGALEAGLGETRLVSTGGPISLNEFLCDDITDVHKSKAAEAKALVTYMHQGAPRGALEDATYDDWASSSDGVRAIADTERLALMGAPDAEGAAAASGSSEGAAAAAESAAEPAAVSAQEQPTEESASHAGPPAPLEEPGTQGTEVAQDEEEARTSIAPRKRARAGSAERSPARPAHRPKKAASRLPEIPESEVMDFE